MSGHHVTDDKPDHLTIRVSCGSGEGRTSLSAFDAALRAAGAADFNILRLSSVIPPGTTVTVVDPDHQVAGGFGDILYAVYASSFTSTPGTEAWAGLSWRQRADGSGAGLFVEHSASSRNELDALLTDTLQDMALRRGTDLAEPQSLRQVTRCTNLPVCSVVIACYRTQGWDTP